MIRQRLFTVVGLLLAPLVVLWATQAIWLDDLAGALTWMISHPASAGHGLNLQDGGYILAFFSLWWDLEQYHPRHKESTRRIARLIQDR